MARVFVNDTTLMDIADAIREKNGSEDTYKPSQMADAVRGIQSGGGVNLFDYTTSLQSTFSHTIFDFENLELEFGRKGVSISNTNCFAYSFLNATGLKRVKVTTQLTSDVNVSYNQMFECVFEQASIEEIELPILETIKPFTMNGTFRNQQKLKKIIGEFDLSGLNALSGISGLFFRCYALEEVRFKPNTTYFSVTFGNSSNLSSESIQSIIDGLAIVDTAQTLTFHKDVKAKLTEEQIATITSKNWTLA